jgi:ornithine cyclodeaminase
MRFIDAATVYQRLDFPSVIDALREMFRTGATVPPRPHYTLPNGGVEATLLLMPAWQPGQALGVKVVSVFPGNTAAGLGAVQGAYLLLDPHTGVPLCLIDGTALTRVRTAAASALAATYLARRDATRLLMVGAGALAPHLIAAHASVRPIHEVRIWNRTPAKAVLLAEALSRPGLHATATTDLPGAVRWAEVVCCATLSDRPLVEGVWLQAGTHLDLVGGFTPHLREADDQALRRARLFVDTREALHEAGDLVQPLHTGVIQPSDLQGDLFDLARGRVPGREHHREITLFKSVGTALEDLAAAVLVHARTSTT